MRRQAQQGRWRQGKTFMCDRFVELIALGPTLRMRAESRGKGVNEAHYLVHQILTQAFADLHRIPSDELRSHLVSALERKLAPAGPAAPRTRTGVLRARRAVERMPEVWRFSDDRGAQTEPVFGVC
jgi:hypothetical protein